MSDREDWGADFFGGLNELPPEPVAGLDQILEAMGTLPAFHDARRWVLKTLGVKKGGAILEAGCGNGVSLRDILDIVGKNGRIVGVDPTEAFIETAKQRAETQGIEHAQYEIGDIREMRFGDGEFDGAFCDKILLHAGPAKAALGEMARVVRKGGRVGAIEWMPFFDISTSTPDLAAALNAIFPKASYEWTVSANLARHFHSAGLANVETRAYLAHSDSLDSHPFWRAFLVHQMPLFAGAGLIDAKTADALVSDLETLNKKGEFNASFVVKAAVGQKR